MRKLSISTGASMIPSPTR